MAGPDQQEEFPLDDRAVLGEEDANVTMVEFGDYLCPFCQEFEFTTKNQLQEDGYFESGDLNSYYLHFPVVDTAGSTNAAVAAECAYNQGNDEYWNLHDTLFEVQQEIGYDDQSLIDLAEENTNVDIEEFESCVTGQETIDTVNNDQNVARANAVDSTPTVFINGERVPDPMDYSQVEAMIESELN